MLDVASAMDVNGLSDLNFRYDPNQADYDLGMTCTIKAALNKAKLIAKASQVSALVPFGKFVKIDEVVGLL